MRGRFLQDLVVMEWTTWAVTVGVKLWARLARGLPCEATVNHQTTNGPKELGQAQGHSVSHSQEGAITDGSKCDYASSFESPGVHRDREGQQVEPHAEEPEAGCE